MSLQRPLASLNLCHATSKMGHIKIKKEVTIIQKLLYTTLLLALATLVACSGQAQTPTPGPVAQTTIPAPVQLTTAVPVEAPEPTEVPAPTVTPTEVPSTATTAPPTQAPAPTDMPAPTATAEVTEPPVTKAPNSLITQLSSNEESCIAEAGNTEEMQNMMVSPDLVPPEERDALVRCLEHDNLLKIFLKGFTDQTGPLSDDTSACLGAGFQSFDLRTMMLTNEDPAAEQASMGQAMAGFMVTLSCLNEEEWQQASPALALPPEGREALQCVSNKLGGPQGIATSLQPKEGEPPLAFFNAASECELTMTGGPPN